MSYSAAFSQGVEIVIYLSIKQKEGSFGYQSIQSISEKLNIPIPSVKRLVSLLKREDILISKTGITGGLSLKRDIKNIRLFDIFQAIEGRQKRLFNFYEDFNVTQFENVNDVEKYLYHLKQALDNAEEVMFDELKSKTILDLIGDEYKNQNEQYKTNRM